MISLLINDVDKHTINSFSTKVNSRERAGIQGILKNLLHASH
jgi:hypothetical protein